MLCKENFETDAISVHNGNMKCTCTIEFDYTNLPATCVIIYVNVVLRSTMNTNGGTEN